MQVSESFCQTASDLKASIDAQFPTTRAHKRLTFDIPIQIRNASCPPSSTVASTVEIEKLGPRSPTWLQLTKRGGIKGVECLRRWD